MKYLSRKNIAKYLYDQLTGNFAGFIVAMSASGLVSRFFETRSIRNLWGIASKKTVISKETFGALEWIISIVIGFVVFEIMTKVVKERLDRNAPALKMKPDLLAQQDHTSYCVIYLLMPRKEQPCNHDEAEENVAVTRDQSGVEMIFSDHQAED